MVTTEEMSEPLYPFPQNRGGQIHLILNPLLSPPHTHTHLHNIFEKGGSCPQTNAVKNNPLAQQKQYKC